MSVVMAFFYTSDVAQLAVPLDNSQPLDKVMRTVHAMAKLTRADSYQLLRLNYRREHSPITHRHYLEHRP